MEFNHGALRYEIKEQFGTYGKFANAMNLNANTVSKLLNGKQPWTDRLIFKAADLLNIEDLREYFFTPKSNKSYTRNGGTQ